MIVYFERVNSIESIEYWQNLNNRIILHQEKQFYQVSFFPRILYLFSSHMSKQDSSHIQYLKQDHIGKVIAQGLASVYAEKPHKPITYLANWLFNYSRNLKQYERIKKVEQNKQSQFHKLQQQNSAKQQEHKKQAAKQHAVQEVHNQFQKAIEMHEYHAQLLLTEFPEFLEHAKHLTGVYIGELNHPPKKITEQDTDENAHLSTELPKVINYIGASKSHHFLVGTNYPLDKAVVTAEAFALPQQQQQQGKYIYVPDVVKNDKIHYMRIPKLGAFIAIPFTHKTYLFETMFDSALAQRKKYNAQLEQFEKEKEAQLQEIERELEEVKTKLQKTEAEQQGAVQEEIKEIELRKEEKAKEALDPHQPELEPKKREYVVCADTLGQDREILEEDRNFLVKFVKKLKQDWETVEFNLLKKDVDLQISYESSIGKPAQQFLQEINHELEVPEETVKELTEIHKQEHLVQYHSIGYKLGKIKEWLTKPEVSGYFLQLAKFRVVKYGGLIQHLLYFLGHSKQQIDIPGTTHLNWKEVRKHYLNETFIKRLLDYEPKGPKPEEVKKYAKVSYLLPFFQTIPDEQVFEYNVGLGVVLKFIKTALTLRKEDVELRKQITEQLKNERNEKLAQNEKIENEKETALEAHKGTIAPEDLDSFNEAEWLKAYEAEHPLVEIPPEIKDDADNDM